MEIKTLRQYIHLLKEKEETEARIKNINKKLERINNEGNVKDHVKGGEGNRQVYHLEGFPVADEDELRAALNKQRRILRDRSMDIFEKTTELEKWLNELDDVRMRRIITKHYIEMKPWHTVAREMGKVYTEESVKQAFTRFMKQNEEKK